MTHRVAVIGGGISGLATAESLLRQGCDVTVFERQVRTGGNAISEVLPGGFLMEHGPTTINASFPGIAEEVDRLGLTAGQVELGSGVRNRFLHDRGRLFGISTNPLGFLMSSYLSPFARLRFLSEIMRPRQTDASEETVHAFVARRFGREFADKVIEPMCAGIFMGDSEQLSVSAAFPKLIELEQRFGSIMRGVIAAKRGSEPGRALFSWRQGIATLPNALAALLNTRIHTGVAVTKIIRRARGFDIVTARNGKHQADAVVLAVQPHVAASLLETLDPEGTDALAHIPAPPIGVVFLGYRREQVAHALDGLGYLSTRSAGQVISGAQFNSTMFPGRAPEGNVAISCYVGGARNPDLAGLDDDALTDVVRGELADLIGVRGPPVIRRVRRWPRGLPHATLGQKNRLVTLRATSQRVEGLYLTGNYLDGVSVANCLASGQATAASALSGLERISRRLGNKKQGSGFNSASI